MIDKIIRLLRRLALTLITACLCFPEAMAQDFAPGVYPDRITLTWSGDPATTQTVTWRTDATVIQARAQVRLDNGAPDLESGAQEYIASTRSLAVKEGRKDHYHHLTFAGLQPGAVYAYRVGDGTHWSEWFQFRTAAVGQEPFSFIYLGDGQNDLKSKWSRTIRQAFRQDPDARFIIHAGDLINRSNTDTEWGEWHHGAAYIHAMIPALPTTGNHEYFRDEQKQMRNDPHWAMQFTLPSNGPAGHQTTVYYTDYQGVRFISLDSQLMGLQEGSFDAQVTWVEELLKKNPMKWTVVFFHHPIYATSKSREEENLEQKKQLKVLFDQYGVDLVLQGHDHTYARGKGLDAPATGPMYVVSIAGPKMYKSDSKRWMDVALTDTQLYQVIRVSAGKLEYQCYKASGELFDSFVLTK